LRTLTSAMPLVQWRDSVVLAPVVFWFNERLVMEKRVKMEKDVSDRDDFGRLLRCAYANGVFVNAETVRNSYALAKAYLPDTGYQKYLVEVENEAKQVHKGLWK